MDWNRDRERRAAKNMTLAGSLFGIVFLIVWCILAASMGARVMLLFGVPMLGLMVYRLIVCVQLMKDDTPSPPKEQDPWERPTSTQDNAFCAYCGFPLREDFAFCPKCGRKHS